MILVGVEMVVARSFPWVSYFIFPTVGALIGYMTNVLAIWMIFNPKRPVNLLLFKWQGLVPKSRERIADNLATTVERELVNAELIKAYLTEEIREKEIKESLVKFILQELDRELPSLKEILGSNYFRLRQFLLDYYVNNHEAVIQFMDRLLSNITSKPLREFLDDNRYMRIREWLQDYSNEVISSLSEKTVGEILGKRDVEELVARLLDRIDEEALNSLYDVLSNKSIYDLYPRSLELSDKLVVAFAQKIKDPGFRDRLSDAIIELVKEKLPLSKFVIDLVDFVVGLRNHISQYLEELADKIEKDPQIVQNVKSEVENFLRKPISEYVDRHLFLEALSRTIRFLRQDILTLAAKLSETRISDIVSPKLLSRLRDRVLEWVDEKYMNNKDEPILLGFYEKYGEDVRELLLRIMTSPQVERLVGETIDRISEKPIGNIKRKLEEYINVEKFIRDFIDAIFDRIVDLMEALVEKIDVRSIVLERIMGYSVEEMEELVFGMMKKEFRTIELLGIPIGFTVGLIQILLRILGI